MADTLILLNRLASIACLVLAGVFIMKKNLLTVHGEKVISILLNRIALPAMIIAAYVKMELTSNLIRNVGIIIVGALVVYGLNYCHALIRIKQNPLPATSRSVFLNGAIHANTAFLAFPLLAAVFGSEGLFYATIYYMVDNILFTTIGMRRFTTVTGFQLPPVTISLLIGVALMIIFNVIGFDVTGTFPYLVCNDLGLMTTPLAFIFMGMIIYDFKIKTVLNNRLAQKLFLVKMIIIPLFLALILLIFKGSIATILIMVILVQASMPSLSILISMSYEYKQDTKLAASIVVISHTLAIITVPILFYIFNLLFK